MLPERISALLLTATDRREINLELLKRLSLPVIMVLLAIGFWISHSLQESAAGIALFLFGLISTHIVQSSTWVSVLSISFLSTASLRWPCQCLFFTVLLLLQNKSTQTSIGNALFDLGFSFTAYLALLDAMLRLSISPKEKMKNRIYC